MFEVLSRCASEECVSRQQDNKHQHSDKEYFYKYRSALCGCWVADWPKPSINNIWWSDLKETESDVCCYPNFRFHCLVFCFGFFWPQSSVESVLGPNHSFQAWSDRWTRPEASRSQVVGLKLKHGPPNILKTMLERVIEVAKLPKEIFLGKTLQYLGGFWSKQRFIIW